MGAMGRYVAAPNASFQPMNCAFGLIDSLPAEPGKKRIRKKADRYEAISARSLAWFEENAPAELRERTVPDEDGTGKDET